MSTAVIISGIFREVENTAATWFFPGDYYLFTQKEHQSPRSDIIEQNIIADTVKFSNKFKSMTFVDRLDSDHPTLNMAWKWKIAYNHLKPYIEQNKYQRFILTRPDFYFAKHLDWDEGFFQDGFLYSTSDIVIDSLGYKFFNDTLLVCDLPIFELLSKFYDYYAPIARTKNIHIHLSEYIEMTGIKIKQELLQFTSILPLRPNTRDMFSNGQLLDKYTVNDLILRGQQWTPTGDQNA